MSEDFGRFDEDRDNPFELMALMGWHTSDDQEDGDDFDWEDLDEDVEFVCEWMSFSALGPWGQFADGMNPDGSNDSNDFLMFGELTCGDHIRLAFYMMSAARRDSVRS